MTSVTSEQTDNPVNVNAFKVPVLLQNARTKNRSLPIAKYSFILQKL